MEKKIDEKVLEKLLKGAKNKIIATDNGIAIEGKMPEVLFILGFLIHQVKESGVNEDLLKETIRIGLEEDFKLNKKAEKETQEELDEEIDKFLKNLSELLSKGLEELEKALGDE